MSRGNVCEQLKAIEDRLIHERKERKSFDSLIKTVSVDGGIASAALLCPADGENNDYC